MQTSFLSLADRVCAMARPGEVLLLNFAGEDSDFVRFNHGLVRQAGRVEQRALEIEVVQGERHVSGSIGLTGVPATDRDRAAAALADLRQRLADVPPDPYLLFAETVQNTERSGTDNLPPTAAMVDAVIAAGRGRDLVGILAAGCIAKGFANSLGQRNWFSTHSFHLDWCFYLTGDKAVKTSYAGFSWDPAVFEGKVAAAAHQLDILRQPPRTVQRGGYRTYLAPAALAELAGMLGWGGFGLKSQRTKTTCPLRMLESGAVFSPKVAIAENTAEGLCPNFTEAGFVKPDRVDLIRDGRLAGCLVSPRSAREFGEVANSGAEAPEALDIAAGDLADGEILERLGEGIYASQLWYLNWSDMPGCRVTGMTRFATFWVENGRIAAPLSVMRFDETLYRALGDNLVALTRERELLPDSGTYGARSTRCSRLPGALIDDFQLTL